ncbi:class I SAM-dependent rRNA methyltransferase [Xylella fastidiosa subsp. sandyi]|uniref:Oxidoreductase n=1 Tax=Xylella fastidiosa subsp. sandyi Ann-1 TaxID=155920 RepID=A0A060HB35_XYLFS|nr:class I SAM-dependent rRNA methyltransferase [Xylella fastidiosa]AIC10152.1 oxidoreductase [Xylella fastidiosa subsp. sandyi Ann-1]KQH74309.1 oxidoreductase [Xylella fastidiosa]RWA44451.1 class I SAM-dependent rRNA methyltransferase [Xylella fastidiosa subsp. sandyi]UIX82079.1 class I SAM-dependent rRNA methyltransferase [Xylella fastidiosa subsp. sandyi]WNY18690.1 class I SAM-dependent rRNA methyltransferase [Xylella fastidiosa]
MSRDLPVIRLKNAWRSSHPWLFQKLLEKPSVRLKPGTIVGVVGVDGEWVGRGFYNGHSRIAVRILETRQDVVVDEAWFVRRIAEAVGLRREVLKLDAVSDAWRVVHSEGDGLSGLVVDRYGDLLVVQFFAAGMFRHREWIYTALRQQFPGAGFHSFADEHVQKQESFDFHSTIDTESVVITEHGVKFLVDPMGAHKTGFFADQRENRQWLSQGVAGKTVLDLCCNTGGFAVYAALRGAADVVGVDIDQDVIQIAKANAKLNSVRPKFLQADIFPYLRDAAVRGDQYDVVILDPAKMTRDRDQIINALKKYLDMNKLALGVVKKGGLFATFSCTGLISEEQFLEMLRRAAFYSGRTIQILKVAGAGPDHPFMAHVQESRYLKATFCRVLD